MKRAEGVGIINGRKNFNNLNFQNGFTFVELLLVVIIIAILAAIAVPLYLNQRAKAWDANVQSDLYNAAVAQATYYVDNSAYSGVVADLVENGYVQSARIVISIPTSGDQYCMQAFHSSDPEKIWRILGGGSNIILEVGDCP